MYSTAINQRAGQIILSNGIRAYGNIPKYSQYYKLVNIDVGKMLGTCKCRTLKLQTATCWSIVCGEKWSCPMLYGIHTPKNKGKKKEKKRQGRENQTANVV